MRTRWSGIRCSGRYGPAGHCPVDSRSSCSARDGEAFDVEFQARDGDTVALATVSSSQVRPVTGTDITENGTEVA